MVMNYNEDKAYVEQLLFKRFLRTLTDEEREELDVFLSENPEALKISKFYDNQKLRSLCEYRK